MDNICQYSECDNVIRGRRKDAKYCSESCKQNNKRQAQQSAIGSFRPRRVRRRAAPQLTGNVMNDIAANSAISLVDNISGLDPMKSVSATVIDTCIPYAIESIKKNPFVSLGFAFLGFKGAGAIFKSCTVVEKTVKGKTVKQKSCNEASGLQKAGGAAGFIIAGNYLFNLVKGSIDTDNSRVRHVSDTGHSPSYTAKEAAPVLFSAS